MRFEELELVCQQAARDLVEREGRPLKPAVVLPLPASTKVSTLPEFPDDDPGRFDLLARFAQEVMRPANAPAWGFVAEAVGEGEAGAVDVAVMVCGARNHPPRVSAAPLDGGQVGEFSPSEDLDPTAMPFLGPLRHAADAVPGQQGGGPTAN